MFKFTTHGLLWLTLVAAVVMAGIVQDDLRAGIVWLTLLMLALLVAASRDRQKNGKFPRADAHR
jgi:hypothetical protein